jgi:hypothetical protein
MSYNLRTIELYFGNIVMNKVAAVLIRDHDKDAPQYYAHKRVEALAYQFIPIELTKRKHLKQIERDPSKLTLAQITI